LRELPLIGIPELAEDIRINGQLNPLSVRPRKERFELIAGCRRRAALEHLGAETALVRIVDLDDEQAYDHAVSENQRRNDLSFFEQAQVCLHYQQQGKTLPHIAGIMGWSSEKSVYRYLRLVKEATPALKDALRQRSISMNVAMVFLDHAVDLAAEKQSEALLEAAMREMSSSEFRRHLARIKGGKSAATKAKEPIQDLKNGSFVLRATRFDATNPHALEESIALLHTALKKAKHLQKAIAKEAGQS
jgi:ParB family chromosome partitioning protein